MEKAEAVKLSPYSGIPEKLKLYKVMAAYAQLDLSPLDALKILKEEYHGNERYEGIGLSVDKIVENMAGSHNLGTAILNSFGTMTPEEVVLLKAYTVEMSYKDLSILLYSIIGILERVRPEFPAKA
jgi:hypothetical protein